MDLLRNSNVNFRKCGEITTAIKLDKKVYALNCGFCSKVFTKLHAFTVHIGEAHEEDLFGCLDDMSCEELSINDRNEDMLTEFKVENNIAEETVEIKFVEITKDGEETVIDFQDPLEAASISKISQETPNVLDVKEEGEPMVHENNEDDYDNYSDDYTDSKNDADFKIHSSESEISSESDNEKTEDHVNSRKLTLAIIARLKEHCILWNSSEPMKKTFKSRIEACKIITMSINEKMGTNLKWNVIRGQIRKLCSKFRSEVAKQKHAESRGKIYTPIWYYDKLSFLNANVKYKPKIKKRTQVNTDELTLAIIESFKKHRVLWDVCDPKSKNRDQLLEAHKSIAISINEQMMTNLKWNHISDRIKKLCHKFRLELQNLNIAKSKGEDYTPIWYYDQLLFLNTGTEYERKKSEMSLASELREYELPLPTFTDSKNLELIDIYKSFSCLWNMEHIEFRVTSRREKAITEMIQEIRTKMNLSLTQDELQKKINSISDAYSQETHRKLKCERLKKIFTPFYKFYEQISFLENNVSPFKCDICEETFDGFSRYKIHKSQHDGSMPFTCDLCNHGFMDVSNYAVHMRRHTRDFPFVCEVCKKRFAINDDKRRHMRCHTGEKPYCCEICGQSFRTGSSLNVHMRRHKKKPSHKCNICSRLFYENYGLTVHMKTHLNIRDKVCNVCGKAFKDTNQLRQHKEIHAEKKEYVCRICGKDFAQRAGLHGHMKSHGIPLTSLQP